ncbi:MAG: glycosyltransferase family 9 protein [Bryobacteraceae bacterium]
MNLTRRLILDYYIGGLLHFLLKGPTILLGKILHRDHNLKRCADVTIVKILGGGSLAIAYPALLALKRSSSIRRLRLVTSPSVRPFGEVLGLFDEIIVIRDNSVFGTVIDSLAALRKLFRCDAMVDLEIHSRLTTVFALLTCALNRVGFYTAISFWRRGLSTHLLFCNVSNGIYDNYDQLAALFGVELPDFRDCSATFRAALGLGTPRQPDHRHPRIGVAPCCSGLSSERTLRPDEWVQVIGRNMPPGDPAATVELHLFGAPSDRRSLDELGAKLSAAHPRLEIVNHAGKKLGESVTLLYQLDRIFFIDSALLHFARMLGKPTVSFFGPTDPRVLLRPTDLAPETVHYFKLSCSPCVHVSDKPPCGGNNICMRFALNPREDADRNPAWVIK